MPITNSTHSELTFMPVSMFLPLRSVPLLLFFPIVSVSSGISSNMRQELLEVTSESDPWRISLSNNWDVLGPFPIHAREQHFISPGFPLNLRRPYHHEQERTWPSSLSKTAQINWTTCLSDPEGNLAVFFSNVPWSKVRATEGWAALQHHSLLRTTLIVQPPRFVNSGTRQPRVLVQLTQGSFFAIVPRETQEFHLEWYPGNIYGMNRAPPNAVNLPGIAHTDKPTEFDFFVSGDYEIRLFGDPRDTGEETPSLSIQVVVSAEERHRTVARQKSHDVVCDFVDGFAFGDALGIGLRSIDGWWTVEGIQLAEQFPTSISLRILKKQLIAPSQTRIVPISISQTEKYNGGFISFRLVLSERRERFSISDSGRISIPITIALHHLGKWVPQTSDEPIRATFFFASSHPTYFLAIPPRSPLSDSPTIPILALHGAGVDIISAPFWVDAIPRQLFSWIIIPTGRTEWGLDWHGASASEAWATLPALSNILHLRKEWRALTFPPDSSAMIIGHSNGAQGAWYLSSRYPDRTVAVLAAAGYLSPAAYVPLTQARGAHFADPALRSILESSFMPDDNALFLSNLADDIPVLAVHGGDDTNVPTWHSREYISIIKSWGKGHNVSYHEDKGQPHWYPDVFGSAEVRSFLRKVLDPTVKSPVPSETVSQFTLTVADPVRSGSLHGWLINALKVPGRLARLHVKLRGDRVQVRTTNVRRFSISQDSIYTRDSIVIDGDRVPKASHDVGDQTFFLQGDGRWLRGAPVTVMLPTPPGRIQNIFDTLDPIVIIIPSDSGVYSSTLSSALRIAHELDVFLKIDSEIMTDNDALRLLRTNSRTEKENVSDRLRGNLIILGGTENRLSRSLLQTPQPDRRTEFGISERDQWLFRDRPLTNEEDLGILFTHPHPSNPSAVAVILSSTSTENRGLSEGFERALRLLFPRTGIAVPDWIIVGREADNMGTGGVIGAGVWNPTWKWNEPMSYMA